MAKDYYATLGVPRTASAEEVRKAYRNLARKHHPDLNPEDKTAKAKFQEVQAAFDVLNDPKKRELYDRYGDGYEAFGGGPAGGKRPWPGGGAGPGRQGPGDPGGVEFDLGDLFGNAGEGGGGFADLFKKFRSPGQGAGGRRGPSRGEDIVDEVTVSFNTSIVGGEVALTLGRADGTSETLHAKIPAGIEPGKKIRLAGKGNPSPAGGPEGDLLLTIRVAPHPHFERDGRQLRLRVPVTLDEALLGAKIEVPTPHGEVTLTVPAGSSSGRRLRVRGHGVRPPRGEPGDLLVELQVTIPPDLSQEEREQIAEIVRKHNQSPRSGLAW